MSLVSSTWRYRSLLGTSQHPIQRIAQKRLQSLLNGRVHYESYASLHPSLDSASPESGLYGNAAGTGTSPSRLESTLIAISEALERWALFANLREVGRDFERLGFDTVPSSIGMAAFPGNAARATQSALHEARERWLVSTWWNGGGGIRVCRRSPAVDSFFLACPWPETQVCLSRTVWNSETGEKCYGFGASHSMDGAETSALRELERNVRALRKGANALSKLTSIERRLLWCSGTAGNSGVQDRIDVSLGKPAPSCPELIVDSEVVGPWTRWTTVWRCLYPMPSNAIDPGITAHLLF